MPVHVLHVVEAIETGVIRHVVDLVENVDAVHSVVMPVRRHGGATDDVAVARIAASAHAVHAVPMRRSSASATNLAAIVRVRSLVRRTRPDVVHGHSTVGGAVARLGAAGSGVPCVYTPHGLSPRLPARVTERLIAPLTDRFVALSESEARHANSRRLATSATTAVVPNGIDTESPEPSAPSLAARLGLDDATPMVVTVGRLAAQKAPEVVIAAWQQIARAHETVHFAWLGEGEDRRQTQELVDAGPAARRIHLLGHVDGASSLLDGVDVFVLASRYEGAPYAPLEAMRAGVAVVATDVVGTRDCIESGHNGVLVPPDDPNTLAREVLRLLDSHDERRRLAANAQNVLEAEFSLAQMCRRTEALYADVWREAT